MSSVKNILIMVVFGFTAVLVAWHFGSWSGQSVGSTKTVAKATKAHVQIREKQNEVRNNRPDRQRLIISLRRHSF